MVDLVTWGGEEVLGLAIALGIVKQGDECLQHAFKGLHL